MTFSILSILVVIAVGAAAAWFVWPFNADPGDWL